VKVAVDPLCKEVFIDAPPSVVFQFLTDPTKMVRWMGVQAEIDPKPGGIYRLDPNGRDVIRGEYLEVIPDSRVVFTWGWETPSPGMPAVPAGSTRVEIDLQAEGSGTRLRLIHHQLPPDASERHAFGWAHYLERLKKVSQGTEPGPDPYADLGVRHG
jgi:uncharacterized protein YndB with AHSA1/START domain